MIFSFVLLSSHNISQKRRPTLLQEDEIHGYGYHLASAVPYF